MPIIKPCAQVGCPGVAARGSRCPKHTKARDQARGTRQARGYDAEYDAAHRDWQRRLSAGELVVCWRCEAEGKPHLVDPRPGHWHLGHDDEDRAIIRGPECPPGNLRASLKRRQRRR